MHTVTSVVAAKGGASIWCLKVLLGCTKASTLFRLLFNRRGGAFSRSGLISVGACTDVLMRS